MNVLSLFDGMSCGQIALERAGVKFKGYYASEVDPYAIKVAEDNYPTTIHVGDVTKVKAEDISPIDLLIGGSPCQGFSFAGKQLAFDDPRSKLFFEYVRLLKECKPKYFLLENVRMKNEYLGVISECLGVDPIRYNSNNIVAANRDRYYWTNITDNIGKIPRSNSKSDFLEDGYVSATVGVDRIFRETEFFGALTATMYKGVRAAGRPIIARKEIIGKHMDEVERDSFRGLTVAECEQMQTVPIGYTKSVSKTQALKMLGNGWTVDVIAHILKNMEVK